MSSTMSSSEVVHGARDRAYISEILKIVAVKTANYISHQI